MSFPSPLGASAPSRSPLARLADPAPRRDDLLATEAAGEAADKGSKMEFAYKKAAKSVKQCPMAFEHPEQTRQLNGVGDSIIA